MMMNSVKRWFAVLVVSLLAGCGGGSSDTSVFGGDAGTGGNGNGNGGGGGTGGTATASDLVLTLSAQTLANDSSGTVTATATAVDANRVALANVPVTISADSNAVITVSGSTTGADGTVTGTVGIGSDRSNRTITVTARSGSLTRTATLAVTDPVAGGGAAQALTIDVRLLDGAGQATSSVLAGTPVRAQAVVKRNGVAVANQIVQFSAEQTVSLVKIDPSAGSQLTDASGTAVVTVSSLGSESGAGRVVATTTVAGSSATSSANFFASGSTTTAPATLTLSAVEVGSASVSAYGTTGARVRVLQNGAAYTAGPVSVNFTTSCPAGRATVTPTATTQPDGYAVATFVDNGCAQTADSTVTITASIATDTESASVLVRSPSTGSLRFVSVAPSDKSITLRGQGGNGRQENAAVTFRLVDVAGQGVGDTDVCFDITTYVGGLNIDGFSPSQLPAARGSATLCGTDNLSVVRYVKRTNPDGTVQVQVNSGTVPTPVRVRARALYPSSATTPLESFSDTLSVSTGLPLQRSFSLSVNQANIDGGNFDGETATVTVRLADQFSNPVPDGTVVNFIGSGASVCTADNGSCRTTNGACSCNVVSQARRPLDNRVIVTAYAVGLENFDDNNGDNVYTPGVDAFQDLGDAYVDSNKDGQPNSQTVNGDTDILIPYQQPNVFKATGDGVRGTAHIRASTVIYLSQSSSLGDPTAVVPLSSLQRDLLAGPTSAVFVALKPICPEGVPLPQASLSLQLDDGIGNPMAAATTLASVDVSDNLATNGFIPSTVLAAGARPPTPLLDYPNLPKSDPWTSTDAKRNITTGHSVTVRGVQDKCSGSASFSLQVDSPRGGPATARVLIEGEPRTNPRTRFPVRYVEEGLSFQVSRTGSTVTLSRPTLVESATVAGAAIPTFQVNWGDGTAPDNALSHTYASAGTYTIMVSTSAAGTPESSSQTVVIP